MNRALLTLALFFALSTQAHADITTSLVGRWAFDENTGTNAADSGSGSNAGTLTNGATWTAPGNIGASSLSLDGSNDYVSIGDPVNLRPGANDFSVCAWFKTSSAARQVILTTYNGNLDIIDLEIGRNTAGKLTFLYRDQSTITTVEYTGATYNDGAWHHVCGVSIANDNLYLYIDSASLATTSLVSIFPNIGTDSQAWDIGAENAGSNWFAGNIDDLRVYHRALSAGDVTELFAYPSVPAASQTFGRRRSQ